MDNKAIHPGEILREELNSLHISVREFSKRTGILEKQLSLLLSCEANITLDIAIRLADFFGQSVQFWINLQTIYSQRKKEEETQSRIDADYSLLKTIDSKWRDLYLPKMKGCDKYEFVRQARVALQASMISNLQNENLFVLYKELNGEKKADVFLQNVWLSVAVKQAKAVRHRPYDEALFLEELKGIRPLTNKTPEEFFPLLKKRLSESGVSLVYVPYLKSTGIFGASCWIGGDDGGKSPVIALSNRGKSADVFWFSFVHEAAHVLMRHTRNLMLSSDDNMESPIEREANDIGKSMLIDPKSWKRFSGFSKHHTSKGITNFAKAVGVDPCIVVGWLAKEDPSIHCIHKSLVKYYDFSFLNEKKLE